MPAAAREIWETGQEPDYTIDDIARVEPLRDGTVRLYIASEYRGGLKVEYTARCSKARLAEFARLLLVIASDVQSPEISWEYLETTH